MGPRRLGRYGQGPSSSCSSSLMWSMLASSVALANPNSQLPSFPPQLTMKLVKIRVTVIRLVCKDYIVSSHVSGIIFLQHVDHAHELLRCFLGHFVETDKATFQQITRLTGLGSSHPTLQGMALTTLSSSQLRKSSSSS